MTNDYIEEALSCALEDVGRYDAITSEERAKMADSLRISFSCYSELYCSPVENPLKRELAETKRLLTIEQNKVVCPECKGSGRLLFSGPVHGANMHCYKCNGSGKVSR